MDLIAHDGAKNNKSPLAYIVVTSEWYYGLRIPSKAFFQRISNVLADWENWPHKLGVFWSSFGSFFRTYFFAVPP